MILFNFFDFKYDKFILESSKVGSIVKNIYSKVTIELTTHDLNGISNLDLKLAKSIDKIM